MVLEQYSTKVIVYKSDNLQYNSLNMSQQPRVWWYKYYFDRLKIKQWVAGLDLAQGTQTSLFLFL